ncbi:MAG: polysaccharide deacetylase family protein [Paludibacteraceae bacterium]|nr:polysaccharide deacetylase family protein [Paludibacteraceae bacterium]
MIDYIIQFLIRDEHNAHHVGYCNDKTQWSKYKVVIVPSNFFDNNIYGTQQSMPSLPLQEIEGIPFLYGSPHIEKIENTIVCYADLIASTYFLISRYEEYINPNNNRDTHGRYIGKQSIPAKANFIHRPIVEEYGELLRKLLQQTNITLSPIPQQINHIYLTHDVDSITNYRRLRGFLGGTYRSIVKRTESLTTILKSIFNINHDPAYTFPWILQQDNLLPEATQIYFIKATHNAKGFDRPTYNLIGKNFIHLKKEILKSSPNAIFGLHTSYRSGDTPDIIVEEQKLLQYAIENQRITTSRHHYLRSLQPNDMEALIDARITDDYTMSYADIAGFRLGTCRAVRFINPSTCKLTSLTLHPLTIMDCTLSESHYMNLNYNQALSYSQSLINEIKKYNGDLSLLWHNTRFTNDNYHNRLYTQIIKYLCL